MKINTVVGQDYLKLKVMEKLNFINISILTTCMFQKKMSKSKAEKEREKIVTERCQVLIS